MDVLNVKLGKLDRPPEAKFVRLSSVLCRPLPRASAAWDGTPGCSYPLFQNDRHGDCVVVSAAHLLHTVAVREGQYRQFTDDEVLKWYYDLSNGMDTGLVMITALCRLRDHGFPIMPRTKLKAWIGLDEKNHEQVKAAAQLFHGAHVGANLPRAAQFQEKWDCPAEPSALYGDYAPGSWGGHAMALVRFNEIGPVFATWAMLKQATWRWWNAYVDESYVLLDEERRKWENVIDWRNLEEGIEIIGGACYPPMPEPPPLPEPAPVVISEAPPEIVTPAVDVSSFPVGPRAEAPHPTPTPSGVYHPQFSEPPGPAAISPSPSSEQIGTIGCPNCGRWMIDPTLQKDAGGQTASDSDPHAEYVGEFKRDDTGYYNAAMSGRDYARVRAGEQLRFKSIYRCPYCRFVNNADGRDFMERGMKAGGPWPHVAGSHGAPAGAYPSPAGASQDPAGSHTPPAGKHEEK